MAGIRERFQHRGVGSSNGAPQILTCSIEVALSWSLTVGISRHIIVGLCPGSEGHPKEEQ